jgi:hypothetical protein
MLRDPIQRIYLCKKARSDYFGLTIYFLAAAENSNSTFEDGEVMGSIIGSLSPDTFEINFTQKISDTHKFEGITFFRKQDTILEFLLCEDNDSDVLESNIYKLTLHQ